MTYTTIELILYLILVDISVALALTAMYAWITEIALGILYGEGKVKLDNDFQTERLLSIFIVGIVGESRLIPIGQHQSQAFLPGDLSLGIMAVALLSLHANKLEKPNYWGYSPIWWLVVLITVSFIAYYARKNDVANYPYRSSISPTKITHDIVGYWLIPTLLIALGIPKLFSNFVHSTLFIDWTSWVTFIGAIAFYIACVIQDYVIGYTTEDVLARHPENWQPIWKR